jgi:hypothetical protein
MRVIIAIILIFMCADGHGQIIRANPFYTSRTFVAPSTDTLLLDSFPNAAAAYSLRKLRTAYSGSAIRVRRSNDNTEQDIGFVNNFLDTASLKTFVGANNGFVTTWYDQSDSARNATQTTAAQQPRIVLSGVISREGQTVGLNFVNSVNRLSSYKFAEPDKDWGLFFVGSVADVTVNNRNSFGTDGNGFRTNGLYVQFGSSTGFSMINRTSANLQNTASTAPANNTTALFHNQYKSNNEWITEINGDNDSFTSALISGNKYTSGDQSVWWMGAYRSSNNFNSSISLNGFISEHIVYEADKTTDRSSIKNNINRNWLIY